MIGGLNVRYGNISSDVNSASGTGSIDTDGYGVGGTLTWYGQNGVYVDGQAQVTWFDSDLRSDLVSEPMVGGNNGFGYAFSLEAGKRIEIEQNWTFTPQAQLAYSSVDFDNFTDPFGANVSLESGGDSLQGRLGISADYTKAWEDKNGRMVRTSLYGIGNLYYDFLDGPSQIDVSSVNLANGNEPFWGGVGAGGTLKWADDKYSLYGEASINTSFAEFGSSKSFKGTFGFQMKL